MVMATHTYASANVIGDVNGDGSVDVADIASIISVMAGGNSVPLSADTAPEEAQAVDLGLPSGTKWANMNVGAAKPGEDGLFFSWGDVTGYSRSDNRNFSYSNYKWGTSKYNSTDGKIELDAEDDAARAHWGGQWAMPTNDEFYELMNNTTWKWERYDGAWGRTFTSKINGNSIFFPAQGYRDSQMNAYYLSGYYWSSSLYYFNPSKAVYFYFRSDADMYVSQLERYYGCAVRPVLRKANENENQFKNADVNGDNVVDVADISSIISIMSGYEQEKAPANAKAIDLGLPSGLKWANMNVGATSPQEPGHYFAWGETKGYTSSTSDGRKFDWASYKWMQAGQSDWKYINKYQIDDGQTEGCWYEYDWDNLDYNFVGDGKAILEPEDDAAHVNWGGKWRMPTWDEIEELKSYTNWEWVVVGSVSGCKLTSKINGNAIFIPAAGYRSNNLYKQGEGCYVRCSTLDWCTSASYSRYFCEEGFGWSTNGRCLGYSVRPVKKE